MKAFDLLIWIGVIVWIAVGGFLILTLCIEMTQYAAERQTLIEERNQTQLLLKGLSGEIQGLNGEVQSLKTDFTVLPKPEGWEPENKSRPKPNGGQIMAKIEKGSYVKFDCRGVAGFDEGPVMHVTAITEKQSGKIAHCNFWSSTKQDWLTKVFPLSTLMIVEGPDK